jgi:hypothetical protein
MEDIVQSVDKEIQRRQPRFNEPVIEGGEGITKISEKINAASRRCIQDFMHARVGETIVPKVCELRAVYLSFQLYLKSHFETYSNCLK